MGILSVLGSCSFQEKPSSTQATFNFPEPQGNTRPLATYACLNVWGPDGRWNSEVKPMARNQRSLSVEFTVPYLWVGRKYNFRILGFDTDPSGGSSSYTCPIAPSSTELNELGLLENQLITKDTTQVIISAHAGFSAGNLCGEKSTNGCYDEPFYSAHSAATLKDGTKIEKAATATAFQIWREKNGVKLLKATGLWSSSTDWQTTLSNDGRSFKISSDPLAYLITTNLIAGRTCPASVYLDDSHMLTGKCLYYTSIREQTYLKAALDNDPTALEGQDYLTFWDSSKSGNHTFSSFYETNIRSCKNAGMRLPTVYEFKLKLPLSFDLTNYPPEDATPVFDSTNGIPTESGKLYLTASAFNGSQTESLFQVNGDPAGGIDEVPKLSSETANLICVLP